MVETNLKFIDEQIIQLVNNELTTPKQMELLADLETARNCILRIKNIDNKKIKKDVITSELEDIFPALKEYQTAKTEYYNNRLTQEGVNHALKKLVVEINEFITILYSNSSSEKERSIIRNIKV